MSSIFYTFILSVILTIVSKPLRDDRRDYRPTPLVQVDQPSWEDDPYQLDGIGTWQIEQMQKLCGVRSSGADRGASFKSRIERARERYVQHQIYQQQIPQSVDLSDEAIDLRAAGFVTPVRNQGRCGSCVAFGTIAALESTVLKHYNKPHADLDLSEHHLFFSFGVDSGKASCDDGWEVEPALDALAEGIVSEAEVPYDLSEQSGTMPTGLDWYGVRAKRWKPLSGFFAMQDHIAHQGAIVAVISVPKDFMSYRSGVYHQSSDIEIGLHAVAIVGYSNAERYWLVKNSWSERWGDRGYVKVGFGEIGIESTPFGLLDVVGLEHLPGTPFYRRQAQHHWECGCSECEEAA